MVPLVIAVIILLGDPSGPPGPPPSTSGQGQSLHSIKLVAHIVLGLFSCLLVILFAFFLLHIRRLSRVLNQATDVYAP